VAASAAVVSLRECSDVTAAALDEGVLIAAEWAGNAAGDGVAGTDLVRQLFAPPAAPPTAAPAQAAGAPTQQAGVRHRQAALTRHVDAAAAATRALAIAAMLVCGSLAWAREMARWRSQASKGAMAFLGALPSSGRSMSGPLMRETYRRALGIERGACGGLCPGCKRPLTGLHARRCSNTGCATLRHHILRDSVAAMATTAAGISGVKKETRAPFVSGAGPTRRMDVVVPEGALALPPTAHEPTGGGKRREACIDVTIVDGTRDDNCRRAAEDIRPILVDASLAKYKTYSPLLDSSRSTLYPAPCDQFGAASSEVHDLLGALSQRQAQNSADGTTRRAALTRAQCMSRCRQALSMALQRGISLSVFYVWGGALPAATGHPPDLGAYRRVTLLAACPAQRRAQLADASQPPLPDDDPDDLEPVAPCTPRSPSSGSAAVADAFDAG
jgi:hypothetical protein